MSVQDSITGALTDGVPFVTATLLWIVVTGIVYSAFAAVWPDVPEAEPWIFLGVSLLPMVGYLGHVLQQALIGSCVTIFSTVFQSVGVRGLTHLHCDTRAVKNHARPSETRPRVAPLPAPRGQARNVHTRQPSIHES